MYIRANSWEILFYFENITSVKLYTSGNKLMQHCYADVGNENFYNFSQIYLYFSFCKFICIVFFSKTQILLF